MAGYLGKISALVTVNTGDFRSKLEGAAKDVQGFARSVQTNITSASRDAAKAFKDIYTPLQQFERSLRAASTMKLSFSGFAGAIKDVDTLRQRLTTLNDRQVSVILRTSGLQNISQFRDAITGLSSRTIDLAVRVGGAEKLTQLRDSILEGDNQIAVAVDAKAAMDRLQSLREQIEEIKRTPVTVPAGGVEQATAKLNEAAAAMKAFVVEQSRGTRTKASGFLNDLNDQVAAGEARIAALREQQRQREEILAGATSARQRGQINRDRPDRSEDIAAVEQEIAGLTSAIGELKRLIGEYNAAKENLGQVRAAAGGGAARGLERAAREQEAEVKRLLTQAQGAVSARLGFDIDTKGLETLLSGGVLSQIERLQSALSAAGVSGTDAATMIARVMTALGTSDLNATTTQLRQLTSAAELVAKPLQKIRQNLEAAGPDIQAAFSPAFVALQERAERLTQKIKELAQGSESEAPATLNRINSELALIQQEMAAATAATNRFVEATSKIGQLKTGQELAFAAPLLSEALARGQRAGEAAMGLPGSTLQANPQIADGIIKIRSAAQEATSAYAALESAMADGLPLNTTAARENLDIVLKKYLEIVAATEREIKIHVDTQEVRQRLSGLSDGARAELLPLFTQLEQRIVSIGAGGSGLEELQARLAAVAGSVERVAAVSSRVKAIDTSAVPFADPTIVDLLNRFAEAQKNATQIPGVARSGDQFVALAGQVQAAATTLERLIAKQEASAEAGDRASIQLQINAETQSLERLIKEYETLSAARARVAQNFSVAAASQEFDPTVLDDVNSAARRAQGGVSELNKAFQSLIDSQRDIQAKGLGTSLFRRSDIESFTQAARSEAGFVSNRIGGLGSQLARRERIDLAVQVSGASDIEQLRAATAGFAAQLEGVRATNAFTQQERAALSLAGVIERLSESSRGADFIRGSAGLMQKSIGGLFKEMGGAPEEFGKMLASSLQQGLVSIKGTQEELTNLIITLSTAKTAADLQLDQKIRISPSQARAIERLGQELSPLIRQFASLEAVGRQSIELAIKVTGAKDLDELRQLLGGREMDASPLRPAAEIATDLSGSLAEGKQRADRLRSGRDAVLKVFGEIDSRASDIAASASAAFTPFGDGADVAAQKTEVLVAALKRLSEELQSSGFPGNRNMLSLGSLDEDFGIQVNDLVSRLQGLQAELRSAADRVVADARAKNQIVGDDAQASVADPARATQTARELQRKVSESQAAVIKSVMEDAAALQAEAEKRTAAVLAPQVRTEEARKEIERLAASFKLVDEAAGASSGPDLFDQLTASVRAARAEVNKLGDAPGAQGLAIALNRITQSSANFGAEMVAQREKLSSSLNAVRQEIASLEQEREDLRLQGMDNISAGMNFNIEQGMDDLFSPSTGPTDFNTGRIDQIDAKLEQLRAKAAEFADQLEATPDAAAIDAFLASLLRETQDVVVATERLTASQQAAKKSAEEFAAILSSLPEGSVPRRRVEGMLPPGGLPPDQPPPDDVRRVADAEAARFRQLGLGMDDPIRQMEQLRSTIVGVKSQLDSLPAGVRTDFIPTVKQLEDDWLRLNAAGPARTAEEIEAATEEARKLSQAMSRVSGIASMQDDFNLIDTGQIQNMDQARQRLGALVSVFSTLSGVAKTETAPAIRQAFDVLRTNSLGEAKAALERIEAVMKSFGVNLRGVGDVGRGGADKLSLALNQAAFAVDDFMSSTGGIEFKLRAVSNNITQLAFILGSTKGLFVGLAAVIAGQAAVALIKWANNGRTAEDRTRSLNDALARQKSLVEELAAAYRSLGDAITRGTLSPQGEKDSEFERQVEDIRRKQEESVRKSVSDFDPEVVKERAEQKKLQRQIEASENPGVILGLQRQLDASRQREKEAIDRAVAAPPPNMNEAQAALVNALNRMGDAAAADAQRLFGFGLGPNEGAQQAEEFAAPFRERAAAVQLPRDPMQARAAVNALIKDLSSQVDSGSMEALQKREAIRQIEVLTQILNSLDAPVRRALDEAANNIVESAREPARQMAEAQGAVARALEAGVDGAAAFASQIDANSDRLRKAFKTLEEAAKESDPEKKQELVQKAQGEVLKVEAQQNALDRQADALDAATLATKAFAEALNRAAEEAKSNLNSAQQAADQARRADLGGSTPRTREERAAAEEDLRRQREAERQAQDEVGNARSRVDQEVARGRGMLDRQARAEEARAIEQDSRDLVRDAKAAGIDVASGESWQSIADKARAAGRSDIAERSERQAARQEAFGIPNAKDFWNDIQQIIEAGAEAFAEAATSFADEFARIREIDEQLASNTLGAGQEAELRAERSRLQAQVQPELDRINAEAQAAVEASTREEEQRQAAARGRELRMTPAQRAAEDVARGLEDIRQAFGREAEDGTGIIDIQGQQQAQRRFLEDQIRAAAPGLANLSDQVENAVLQGPSRASLQATDASTVEGMRELDRLLRGDTGVDQNIVELQKQTNVLEGIKAAVEEMAATPVLNM